MNRWLRRTTLALFTAAAAGATAPTSAWAQEKVTFMTSWYAQAEHGGFYLLQLLQDNGEAEVFHPPVLPGLPGPPTRTHRVLPFQPPLPD